MILFRQKSLKGVLQKHLLITHQLWKNFLYLQKKSATEISSEDIRAYLSNFQTSRQVSKMTIDNNRRFFSTFFSWLENEDLIVKSSV